jgi:hypothetical protein
MGDWVQENVSKVKIRMPRNKRHFRNNRVFFIDDNFCGWHFAIRQQNYVLGLKAISKNRKLI